MKKILVLVSLLFVFLIMDTTTLASKSGVGVHAGDITVREPLKPGQYNDLPGMTVINTGDIASYYHVIFEEAPLDEGLLSPKAEWFTFSPKVIYLEPGESDRVNIQLNLPISGVRTGDYYGYLVASATREPEDSKSDSESDGTGVSIGVAAAKKLYFSIEPANIFQALYYKLLGFYEKLYPWSLIVPSSVAAIVVFKYLGKNFKIEKKGKSKSSKKKENVDEE